MGRQGMGIGSSCMLVLLGSIHSLPHSAFCLPPFPPRNSLFSPTANPLWQLTCTWADSQRTIHTAAVCSGRYKMLHISVYSNSEKNFREQQQCSSIVSKLLFPKADQCWILIIFQPTFPACKHDTLQTL